MYFIENSELFLQIVYICTRSNKILVRVLFSFYFQQERNYINLLLICEIQAH